MPDIIGWPAGEPLPASILKVLKDILDAGNIIVYPADTVYGLGASIYSVAGIERVRQAKNRPQNIPFIVMAAGAHIRELCLIPEIASPFFERQDILVTAILPARNAPASVQHDGTVAVRLPSSRLTESLIGHAGPVISTSANIHGEKPSITCQEAIDQFDDDVVVYIDSGEMAGVPTTIIDFTGEKPKVIREGSLSHEAVLDVYG